MLSKYIAGPAAQGFLEIIDNFDREATVYADGLYADGLYADADTYDSAFENEPGKRSDWNLKLLWLNIWVTMFSQTEVRSSVLFKNLKIQSYSTLAEDPFQSLIFL